MILIMLLMIFIELNNVMKYALCCLYIKSIYVWSNSLLIALVWKWPSETSWHQMFFKKLSDKILSDTILLSNIFWSAIFNIFWNLEISNIFSELSWNSLKFLRISFLLFRSHCVDTPDFEQVSLHNNYLYYLMPFPRWF